MYTLYSMQRSGNSYKVRLALARLGIPFKLVEIDILQGASRTPEFLAKNPNGHVPLLEVAPNRYLPESNAILWYVAGGTTLAPEDRIDRAEAMQWMFFEQHSLEPNIGAAYFWLALVKGGRDLQQHALEDWMENGYRALGVMEMHLAGHPYFAANHFTIADIALYAYTHVANQCRFRPRALSGDPRLARPRRGGTRPCDDGLAAGSARRGAVAGFLLAHDLVRKPVPTFSGSCAVSLFIYRRHENAAFHHRLCPNRDQRLPRFSRVRITEPLPSDGIAGSSCAGPLKHRFHGSARPRARQRAPYGRVRRAGGHRRVGAVHHRGCHRGVGRHRARQRRRQHHRQRSQPVHGCAAARTGLHRRGRTERFHAPRPPAEKTLTRLGLSQPTAFSHN